MMIILSKRLIGFSKYAATTTTSLKLLEIKLVVW